MGIVTAARDKNTSSSNNNRKDFDFRKILRIISVLIPLAVIGNVIYAIVGTEAGLIDKVSQYDYKYLLLAAGLVVVPLIGHTIRMIIWGRKFGVRLKVVQAFKTALIADIGSAATPTMVGGGYIKLFFLIGYGFTPGRATLLMVLGSLEDIIFFGISLPIVIYLTRAWDNFYVIAAVENLVAHWPVLLGLIAGVSLLIFLYNYKKNKYRDLKITDDQSEQENHGLWAKVVLKFRHYKNDFLNAVKFILKEGKGTLLLASTISGIGWTCRYASINALILGLGYDVDPLLYTLLHWVVFSTMTMIPTPGAVGGAELSFALVFSGLIPTAIIPVMTGVWRFITFYMVISLGAIYMAIVGPKFPPTRGNEISAVNNTGYNNS